MKGRRKRGFQKVELMEYINPSLFGGYIPTSPGCPPLFMNKGKEKKGLPKGRAYGGKFSIPTSPGCPPLFMNEEKEKKGLPKGRAYGIENSLSCLTWSF